MITFFSFFIGFGLALLIDKTFIQRSLKDNLHPTLYLSLIMAAAIVKRYLLNLFMYIKESICPRQKAEQEQTSSFQPRKVEFFVPPLVQTEGVSS